MAAFVRYRGEVRRAQLRSATFHGRELFVIADIDGYKVEKEIHFSSVVGYDWSWKAQVEAA